MAKRGTPVGADDVEHLRRALTSADLRAATLAELASLMSEGRNPEALAQRAVELTARATQAHGAYVYLWDKDEEVLVLRVATEGMHSKHVDQIKLRLGEGVTGWSALMRTTVVLQDDPLADPRFKPFPELRESSFKSMVAVPIVAPGQEVLGVFSLYGRHRNAFADPEVNLATEVGSLLASGLVQAETLAALQTQSAAARFLADLPGEAWGSQEHSLRAMASECALTLDADVCVIEVAVDRADSHGLTAAVGYGERFRLEHPDLIEDEADRASVLQTLPGLGMHRIRIPLGVGVPIGALSCYRSKRFSVDDERLLESIGTQIAAATLSAFGRERIRPVVTQVLDSTDPELTGELLTRFGWAPGPAWPLVLRVHSTSASNPVVLDDRQVMALLTEALELDEQGPLLLGGNGSFLALVSGDDDDRQLVTTRVESLGRRPGLRVVCGIGPQADSITDLHHAIRHAVTASHWAALMPGQDSTVVAFETIARLRLLPRTAVAMSAELGQFLDAFSTLVSYDLQNGTDLAPTLAAFLASSGSVARTSALLFIHRNTLRQRIQRIEEIVGTSLEDFSDWVTAGLAAKLILQAESELSGGPQGARSGSRCPHGFVTLGRGCCGMPSRCVLLPAPAPVS